jgi:23S rRNA (uracil1939-C5)-methyltransferase
MSSEQVKVKCIGMDEEGKGIVKIKGREVHVPYLIEGETATLEVHQKGNFITARVIRIEEESNNRVEPACPHYNQCGGCQLQHLSYEGQAEFKQKSIEKLMGSYHKVNPILTMEEPYYYRNKVHSTAARDPKGNIVSGIYEENTHRVIPIEQCIIQDRQADKIISSIREIMKSFKLKPYDEDTGQGFLRHILVKTGFASKQVMVVLIVASHMFPAKNNFVRELLKKHPEVTTIVMNINSRKTSVHTSLLRNSRWTNPCTF